MAGVVWIRRYVGRCVEAERIRCSNYIREGGCQGQIIFVSVSISDLVWLVRYFLEQIVQKMREQKKILGSS